MYLKKSKFSQMAYESLIQKSEQLLMTINEDLDELKEKKFDESLLNEFKQKLQEFEQNDWDLNNKIIWSEAVLKRDETVKNIKLQLRRIASIMLNIHPNGKNFNFVYGLSRLSSMKMDELVNLARSLNYRLTKDATTFKAMGLAPEENQKLGDLISTYDIDSAKELDLFKQRKYATMCRHEAAEELLNYLRKLSHIGIYAFIDTNNAKATRYFIDSGGGTSSKSSTTEEQDLENSDGESPSEEEVLDFIVEPQSPEIEA